MSESLLRRFGRDVRFYDQLRRPGKKRSSIALLVTLLTSRGLWLLTWHRIAFRATAHRNVRSPFWWLLRIGEGIGKYLAAVFCKSEIIADCSLPDTAWLSNRGYLICGAMSIGSGTLIHDHVTFGQSVASGRAGRPTIGNGVWIGPNSIIAGPLTIGDGATILPGSYLTTSVPPRSVVKGNPARVVRTNFDNTELRTSLRIVREITVEQQS